MNPSDFQIAARQQDLFDLLDCIAALHEGMHPTSCNVYTSIYVVDAKWNQRLNLKDSRRKLVPENG